MSTPRAFAPVRVAAAALGVAAIALLLFVAGARAAAVVNGDFETGNLAGWTTSNSGPDSQGTWFAYAGEENPLEGPLLIPPPQGTYAAGTAQETSGLHVLYQDIALPAGESHELRMDVFYDSQEEIVVPQPESFDFIAEPNQQYRVDVMRPSAPVDSLAPDDILTTVFATKEGDPRKLEPEVVKADLSRFAGQTVRLRLAEVDNRDYFNAGADAVSIASTPLPPAPPALASPAPPANSFALGKLKLNRKNGTATVAVTVPGAGTLAAVDARAGRMTVKKQALALRSSSATAAGAGTTTLKLKPTGTGKQTLRAKGKLRFRALITFTPTGGTAATQNLGGTLKLTVAKATAR